MPPRKRKLNDSKKKKGEPRSVKRPRIQSKLKNANQSTSESQAVEPAVSRIRGRIKKEVPNSKTKNTVLSSSLVAEELVIVNSKISGRPLKAETAKLNKIFPVTAVKEEIKANGLSKSVQKKLPKKTASALQSNGKRIAPSATSSTGMPQKRGRFKKELLPTTKIESQSTNTELVELPIRGRGRPKRAALNTVKISTKAEPKLSVNERGRSKNALPISFVPLKESRRGKVKI